MRKTLLALFTVSVIYSTCIAQNEPVPAYLITQDFPDSVKSLSIVNLQGEYTSFGNLLQKYKGQKVVVDVWASWCRDCIVSYPKLNTLMTETSDQNIVYVFISIDESEEKWKSAIAKLSMGGDHYRIPSGWKNSLSRYLVLDWVPRYFILSDEGMITAPKAITTEEVAKLVR